MAFRMQAPPHNRGTHGTSLSYIILFQATLWCRHSSVHYCSMIYSRHPTCWHSGAHRRRSHNSATLNMFWLSMTPTGDDGSPLFISSDFFARMGDKRRNSFCYNAKNSTHTFLQEYFFSSLLDSTILHRFTIHSIYIYLARYLRLLLRRWMMKPNGIT